MNELTSIKKCKKKEKDRDESDFPYSIEPSLVASHF